MTNNFKNLFDLQNKNVVITGANGFLGRVYSEAISQMGANPIMLDINSTRINNFIKKIKLTNKNNPTFYKCDISKKNNIVKVFNKIKKKYKKIDALVNNAALNPKVGKLKNNFLENFDTKLLKKEIDVGLIGALNCISVFGSHFAENRYGSIINISSDLGVIAPNQSIYNDINSRKYKVVKPVSYSLIKSSIIGLTKYTATYWGKDNVRCNTLAPGGVYEKSQDKEFVKKISTLIPMGRMATQYDIIGALCFLLSDSSSYVNGQVFLVDGGRTAW